MQAIMETAFDAVYLITVLTLGIRMIRQPGAARQFHLFGWMAVVLGPAMPSTWSPAPGPCAPPALENYAVALGLGKAITSVTMTVFYVLLYYVWRQRYRVQGQKSLTGTVYLLAGLRILLCLMPQNRWLEADAPLSWGIYRNIPFALLGLLMIVLFYRSARAQQDRAFRWMWLTIVLSFTFYIPVVLWADVVPMIGMLMIPKTCAYVWTVLIGYTAMKRETPMIQPKGASPREAPFVFGRL